MRRIAILALSIWVAVFASIAVFSLFWRIGYYRPHVLWGLLSLAVTFIPVIWLAASVLWRCVRGPCRLRGIGWFLAGATPLVWIVAFLIPLNIDRHAKLPYLKNAPAQVAGVWASWIPDIEARWHYPRWTDGRHALLIDDGQTPSPERLVAEMDCHIQAMSDLLGQPVPNTKFPWVRGSLFGYEGHGYAFNLWAICDEDQNSGELTHTDRHEVAHTLIRGLSGPDQDPPPFLLEGWAESQSCGRDDLIGYLAKMHKNGETYSLQTLVEPDFYDVHNGASYWEGGPIVLYLMERYGPKTFFRLYSGVRCDSFHYDCKAILGDSWKDVEDGFWQWLDTEAKPLNVTKAEKPDATPAVQVELAPSVNPADWQMLVQGYRAANKDPKPLPSNTAFVLESDMIETKSDAPGSAKRTEYEFRVVFEGERFWIFDNFRYGANCFLLGKPVHNAELLRSNSGSLEREMRDKASELLGFYLAEANPSRFLPLSEKPWNQDICHIERVVRPTGGSDRKWSIWFTKHNVKAESDQSCQVELDPEHSWWITRVVGESYEMESVYERLGDALMPVTLHIWSADKQRELTVHQRVRPMSEIEREELKQRVERAALLGREPYQRLRSFLLAIVIACPLVGATLLCITRRCESAKGTP